MNALEVQDLTKTYRGGFTLGPLSLTLPSGCILGLIGENGAGKTTVIKLLLNMLQKDGGSIRVLGLDSERDSAAIKEQLGVVLDEPGFPGCFTAKQIEKILAPAYADWDSARYAGLLRALSVPTEKRFSDFSKGTKMKLSIAAALSHGAKLLLLDEPTGGLDPVVRDEVVEMLRDFASDGEHSVLISSHIVSDLEKLCDYVAFLHGGKLLLAEEKDRLTEKYGILQGSEEELATLAPGTVKQLRVTPYGAEALVLREKVGDRQLLPVSIEELFVMLIKGGKKE